MGERQYVPGLGRFLEVDPVERGSDSDYDYCNGDPIGCLDLDGCAAGPYLNKCGRIKGDIIAAMRELSRRRSDLLANKEDLPWAGKDSVAGHMHQFRGWQRNLKKALSDYARNGCGKPPKGAQAWINTRTPVPRKAGRWSAELKKAARRAGWVLVGLGAIGNAAVSIVRGGYDPTGRITFA